MPHGEDDLRLFDNLASNGIILALGPAFVVEKIRREYKYTLMAFF